MNVYEVEAWVSKSPVAAEGIKFCEKVVAEDVSAVVEYMKKRLPDRTISIHSAKVLLSNVLVAE